MKDSDFRKLELQSSICPDEVKWPNEHYHWQLLHKAAEKVRELVQTSFAKMDAIERASDYTPQGKQRRRAKIGQEALAEIAACKSVQSARDSVASMQARWQAQLGLKFKTAETEAQAVLHAQIRDRLFHMKDSRDRLSFLEKHAGDMTVLAAILEAPPCVSNLSTAELAMVQVKAQGHLNPDIIAARDEASKALQELEQGWERAQVVIAQRAGLQKGQDGVWTQPADAAANAA